MEKLIHHHPFGREKKTGYLVGECGVLSREPSSVLSTASLITQPVMRRYASLSLAVFLRPRAATILQDKSVRIKARMNNPWER